MRLPCWSVATAFALPLCAQSVSVTVVELNAGELRAEHTGAAPADVRTIPALTNLTQGLSLQATSGVAHGAFTLAVTAWPVITLDALVTCQADATNSANGATLHSSADLAILLYGTAPVESMVSVWIRTLPSGGAPGAGIFSVDVDGDGVVDIVGNPQSPPPFEIYREFRRDLASGLSIRIQHSGSITVPAHDLGEYLAHVVVRCFPASGPVTSYGQGCGIELREQRAANGDLVFSLQPAQAPGLGGCLLFGWSQANAPAPVPPGCPFLTSNDTWLWWNTPQRVVPIPPLPTGFTMYAQAALFVSPAQTLLSDGLRLHVGP